VTIDYLGIVSPRDFVESIANRFHDIVGVWLSGWAHTPGKRLLLFNI